MLMLPYIWAALLSFACVEGKTHYFDWNVEWVTANPDGMKERQVVGINGQWPLPLVEISMGDRLVVNVTNSLFEPYRHSTIHFHGLFQNGTNAHDGPSMVTQTPTPPGQSFLYNFTIDQAGTYWYHTHVDALYPDGYRQMLLVHDDNPWFKDQYDEELSFSMQDWYHELIEDITDNDFLSLYNPTGAEPVPQSIMMNDTTEFVAKVKPNTTYRLRVANTGAFSAFYFYIKDYNFTIVEVDGVYTKPAEATSIYVATAQRYSLLFTTGPDANTSYQMVQITDSSLYDVVPHDLQMNRTHYLVTSDDAERVEVTVEDMYNDERIANHTDHDGGEVSEGDFTSDFVKFYDDYELVPFDEGKLLEDPAKSVNVTLSLTNLLDGKNYAFMDSGDGARSFTMPKVPTLYSVMSAPDDATANNETIYGRDSHAIVIEYDTVFELILNNFDSGKHPFHLHGHNFQVVKRPAPWVNNYGEADNDEDFYPYTEEMQKEDEENNDFPESPMRRDVVVVNPYSHVVLRWRGDNPGVWIFHCHIDWHMSQGLAMLFVEAPTQIRQNQKIPDSHIEGAKAAGFPVEGNAAAHTEDFFDLSGQNEQQPDLPGGFTARGIVALVFSFIAAFLGMGFLTYYGLTDTTEGERHEIEVDTHERVISDDVSAHRGINA